MIGWIADVAAADAHFLANRLDTTAWDALTVTSSKNEKQAVLQMAYDRLRFCKDFTIPAAPTAAQLEGLALAQHETAYYLAMHIKDEDRRKGIQAQGVNRSDVVHEGYADAFLSKLPLPPIVYEIMESLALLKPPEAGFYAVEIARDENEDIDVDVTDD